MKAWFLIVLFTTTDDAKVAVYKTKKDCEVSKGVTMSVIGKHPDVKSITCEEGYMEKNKNDTTQTP